MYPYEKIIDAEYASMINFENLLLSYNLVKGSNPNSRDCYDFSINLYANLEQLLYELLNFTYNPLPPIEKEIFDIKYRIISAPRFRDRIVQRLLSIYIQDDVNNKLLLPNTYACIKNRGTFRALNHAIYIVKNCDFVLNGDIHHYFNSICTDIMLKILASIIKDPNVFWLASKFVPNLPNSIIIGSVTSQIYANIYLHMLDNFVVNDLNTKNYVRYMDDFVIGLNDYNKACSLITILSDFLFNNLRLTLKPTTNVVNTNIFPYEFLGYTIYKNGSTFIRDSIIKDLIKEIVFYKYHGYSYEELFRNRLLYVLNALYFIKDFNAYNYIMYLLYYYNIQSPILNRPTKEEENFNKDFGVYMKSFFKKYM